MVKLIPHGMSVAIPVPLDIARQYGLKAGKSVHVIAEQFWIRVKKVSDVPEPPPDFDPDTDGSYSDFREAQKLAELETPSTIGFFAKQRPKR